MAGGEAQLRAGYHRHPWPNCEHHLADMAWKQQVLKSRPLSHADVKGKRSLLDVIHVNLTKAVVAWK